MNLEFTNREITRSRRLMPSALLGGALLYAAVLGVLTTSPAPALAQFNYAPLQRGDYSEEAEKQIVLKGLDSSVDYALQLRVNNNDDLPSAEQGSNLSHDLRLKLRTVFHRDVSVHLTLALSEASLNQADLRSTTTQQRGDLVDAQPLALTAREAFLRYYFNPNSAFTFGKQEVSLGDYRGKIFHGIVPGFTFDCQLGTWCFPAGLAHVGPAGGDSIFHWALQYTAWDNREAQQREMLEVALFRVFYTESDIPLANNMGPGVASATNPYAYESSQVVDPAAGDAVYYDARNFEYYGLRARWEGPPFFANMDATVSQGNRRYHLYPDATSGTPDNLLGTADTERTQSVRGVALEAEMGYRWDGANRVGLRVMNATGDPNVADPNAPKSVLRNLKGYHEITPGAYRGSRLYFNGGDSAVDEGAGLGHSINNTRLIGFFLDVDARESKQLGYSLGLYKLQYNHPVLDAAGNAQSDIGLEIDNLLTWYFHKALRLQVELNVVRGSGAFSVDDYTAPQPAQDMLVQSIGRLLYSF